MVLVLIDVSALIYKAHHTLSPTKFKRPSDGKENNVVYGVASMTLKILETIKKEHKGVTPVACMDSTTCKESRKKVDEKYKQQRQKCPETMRHQFEWVKELYDSLNIVRDECEEYEADDIIASYAKRSKEYVIIVSPDKDMCQLVNENVCIYDAKAHKYITTEDIKLKYDVYPEEFVEYQSILGDKIDNVPGIKGIGKKRAAEIINQKKAGELKEGYKEMLEENAEQISINKKLVQLIDSLDIKDTYAEYNINKDKFGKFLEKMEIQSAVLKKYTK
jgi:DNA polymerase-1